MFLPQFQDLYLEKPAEVFTDVDFEVVVSTGTRAFTFEHKKPVAEASLLPPDPRQKKDEFSPDLSTIVEWITGGDDGMRSHETDIWGIVKIKVDDFSSQFAELSKLSAVGTEKAEKEALKELEASRKKFLSKVKDATSQAEELANLRVMRAIRLNHRNLVKQYETLSQEGKGGYRPSTSEYVGMLVLEKEIEKKTSVDQAVIDKFKAVARTAQII